MIHKKRKKTDDFITTYNIQSERKRGREIFTNITIGSTYGNI